MDFFVECRPLKYVDLSFQEQSVLFDERFCDCRNVIRIVTYYTLPPIRVANLVLDCNGDFAIKAYRPLSRRLDRCDRVIQDEVGDSIGGNV